MIRALSFAVALAWAASAAAEPAPLATVPKVDLARYLGLWHEIARYPNEFQPDDCLNVTAEYAQTGENEISVVNTCRDAAGGVTDRAEGSAYVADEATGAKLRVAFFWPFYGDYWVIDLAEDYSWAVVSEPEREYLWILARGRTLDAATKDGILTRLREKGFDTSKLVWKQTA